MTKFCKDRKHVEIESPKFKCKKCGAEVKRKDNICKPEKL